MLIVFGGLPGTGKTSIAMEVARRSAAAYLRIDAIEQAIRKASGLGEDVGPVGYEVGYALAEANLALGRIVVADSVNPIAFTREGWRQVAARTGATLLEVEIVCSDAAEHRRRVEQRQPDIAGLALPSWEAVVAREYEPWLDRALAIDTATMSVSDAASLIVEEIDRMAAEARRPVAGA
jgi:predicted kinase